MARKSELTDAVTVAEVMEAGVDDKSLRGKSFSITGHLSKTRADVVALIERAGGRFDDRPKWDTSFLITNADWSAKTATPGASKKFEAALRNGTRIISERAFLELLTRSP